LARNFEFVRWKPKKKKKKKKKEKKRLSARERASPWKRFQEGKEAE
jgi:hypothetical protein